MTTHELRLGTHPLRIVVLKQHAYVLMSDLQTFLPYYDNEDRSTWRGDVHRLVRLRNDIIPSFTDLDQVASMYKERWNAGLYGLVYAKSVFIYAHDVKRVLDTMTSTHAQHQSTFKAVYQRRLQKWLTSHDIQYPTNDIDNDVHVHDDDDDDDMYSMELSDDDDDDEGGKRATRRAEKRILDDQSPNHALRKRLHIESEATPPNSNQPNAIIESMLMLPGLRDVAIEACMQQQDIRQAAVEQLCKRVDIQRMAVSRVTKKLTDRLPIALNDIVTKL